ncbi:hypothetical protein L873DRAFT_1786412 [Choiromyces venosus 120613-1]|uniref:Uncharacterized protein n=1 Tax=Choiromyces venosus 120613-1 TaxID=1336337 RepID=A0A3N4K0S9_9PEZI|nr:hypothetical protein L873DRAFT_1786412 [Choiromyces venosus 120613-1]
MATPTNQLAVFVLESLYCIALPGMGFGEYGRASALPSISETRSLFPRGFRPNGAPFLSLFSPSLFLLWYSANGDLTSLAEVWPDAATPVAGLIRTTALLNKHKGFTLPVPMGQDFLILMPLRYRVTWFLTSQKLSHIFSYVA